MFRGSGADLVCIQQVADQVHISVHRLLLAELRLDPVQPVHQRLQGVRKLTREQEGLLQLVLPERERTRTPRDMLRAWRRLEGTRRGKRKANTSVMHRLVTDVSNSTETPTSFSFYYTRLSSPLCLSPHRLPSLPPHVQLSLSLSSPLH